MRKYLTGDDLYSWIMMLRPTDRRAFLLVEGDSDCHALDAHLDHAGAVPFPGHAKTVVERAMDLVLLNKMPRVLGILDRDFVDLLTPPRSANHFVYTDDYDLDATILLDEQVFGRVCSANADRAERDKVAGKMGCSLYEGVRHVAAHIGALRFTSQKYNLNLNLEKFPVQETMRLDGGIIDISQTVLIAQKRSKSIHTRSVVEALLLRELVQISDLRRFCNGHDVASALSYVLKAAGAKTSKDAIERCGRSAFSRHDLERTSFYQLILDWSARTQSTVWLA